MGVELIGGDLDHRNGNVRAVVGDALIVGQQIVQHKAVLDRAGTGLQAGDVAALDLAHKAVHDLLQRLDLFGGVGVALLEGIDRAVHDVLHGGLKHAQVAEGLVTEFDRLVADLLGRLDQVDGMVGDALKIADRVQQRVDGAVVVHREMLGAQLDKVGAQHVLIVVHGVLLADDLIGDGVIPDTGRGHGLQKGSAADLGHIAAGQHGAAHSHGGGGEQTVVQQGVLLLGVGGGIGHGQDGKLLEQAVERQQDCGRHDIKDRVDDGNAEGVGRVGKEAEPNQRVQAVEPAQEDDSADQVEVEMNKSGALGVLVGARGGNQRSDGGADVLAHDDGHSGRVGDRAGAGQRLQNTDRRRRGLQHSREHSARDNAEDGIFEAEEQIHEPRLIGQRGHGMGHRVHAGHQNGEAQHNFTNAALAVLADHIHPDADKAEDRAPGIGVHHLGDEAVTLEAGQRQQPAGDGGADIRAHDHADGLMQLHQAGVDEADRHNGGGTAGLNDGGDGHAEQQAAQGAAGHGGQDSLQLTAGCLLQRFTHQVHAIQEHGNAAHQGEHIKNGHPVLHIHSLFCFHYTAFYYNVCAQSTPPRQSKCCVKFV